ncbi:MAG: ABC transporter substrate-binding protein [Patescibacteria group bacterium]
MEKNKVSKLLLWLLVFVLVLAGALLAVIKFNLLGFNSSTKTVKDEKVALDNISIGTIKAPKNIYPMCANEGSEIAFNSAIFETLATFNRDNIIVPVLATKWDNPDNKTWRFYLSSEAKFSNGDPVTADDVKFTFDTIRADETSQMSTVLPTAEVKVIDSGTVEFITQNPDPVLLNKLAGSFFVMSKKDIEENGFNNKNIGSGPYIVSEFADGYTKMTVNDSYWGDKPKVKNVTYKSIESGKEVDALINGDIDLIFYLTPENKADIRLTEAIQNNKVYLAETTSDNVNYFDIDSLRDKTPYINLDSNPLKDKRVREAITLSLDMDDFITDVPDTVIANQMVTRGVFGYNPSITKTHRDVTKAKELMKEAGYENGFTLTVDIIESSTAVDLINRFSSYLTGINVKLVPNSLSQDDFFGKVVSKDTSAFFVGFSTTSKDASEVLEGMIHTPSDVYGQYNLGYSNATLDKMIEEASITLNQQTRQQELQEAMKIAMEDYAKIPLFSYSFESAVSSKIYWQPRVDALLIATELAGKVQ